MEMSKLHLSGLMTSPKLPKPESTSHEAGVFVSFQPENKECALGSSRQLNPGFLWFREHRFGVESL